MLRFDNVTKTYEGRGGAVKAIDHVTLSIDAGDFVAVSGPSGCGKSTLLLCAGALLRPTSGDVRIVDLSVYSLSVEARARLRAESIGFVFQQFHLVPYLSVIDNVLTASLAAPRNDARSRAEALLERFNLGHRAAHVPAELSTGERQRTALARALLNEPKLLLADEPTGNLDPDNAAAVLQCLRQFADDGGAVLLVTHDQRAAEVAPRTLHMREGRIKEE